MDHDIHADAVHDLVTQKGYTSYRLDPEAEWPPSCRSEDEEEWLPSARLNWSLTENEHSSSLTWHDQKINLREIGAIFCRNFQFAKASDAASTERHLKFAEMRAGLYGALKTLDDCLWINCPWVEDLVDNKMIQGRDAKSFGLKVPKTLVTNDEDSARKFIGDCPGGTIIKTLSEVGLINTTPEITESYGFYTSLVTDEILEHLSEVTNAPCLFQEAIPKKADVRVTVVGDKLFSYVIDSQSTASTVTDFRKGADLPVKTYDFPKHTGNALLSMLKSWGIVFAACDFALTPDDELIFFEANVTGNWLWLEDQKDHPILNEIVHYLTSYLDK